MVSGTLTTEESKSTCVVSVQPRHLELTGAVAEHHVHDKPVGNQQPSCS